MDVYAPTNATSSSRLPVFFFIQGGGFNSDSNPNLNGTGLINAADMDLIVVTFNYRVGPYGFLGSKEVQADGGINAGMFDQRKALAWVNQHISKVWYASNSVDESSETESISLGAIRDMSYLAATVLEQSPLLSILQHFRESPPICSTPSSANRSLFRRH